MRRVTVATSFAFSLLAYGAVSSVQVGDPARQQGVVSFRVKDPNQCTVTAYQDSALSTKADDTNNALFAGSESCARAYNIVNGSQVTAVIGRRTSEPASDGKLHSRSLEVSRTYYVVITDLTDSNSATISFATGNIPWGDTHVEEVPYSDTGYNHWAYPDLDWSDAGENKWYVDPVSGVSVKRTPRQTWGNAGTGGYAPQQEIPFAGAASATWTNSQNALNTSTAGPFASYSGTAQGTLYMTVDVSNGIGSYYTENGPHIEDLRVNIYGYATDTGNVEDRKILVCLATQYNPATDTCNTVEREVILPTTASEVQFPTSYPSYQFAGWNIGRFLGQDDVGVANATYWGSAKIVNSSVTLGNNALLPSWARAGTLIKINGNWYTISAITDAAHFTLTQGGVNYDPGSGYCGNTAGACWYLGTLGFRIRKKTTTNNQINVAATYSVAWSNGVEMPPNGVPDFCSALTFSVTYAADGATPIPAKNARLCYNKAFLFMLADDGETRYLSHLDHGDVYGGGTPIKISYAPFSATDPLTLIAQHSDDSITAPFPSVPQYSLYEVKYDAATCKFKTVNGGYNYAARPTDCMIWTNKMRHADGKSIQDQMVPLLTANPLWDSSFDLSWAGLTGISGNWASLAIPLYQQNAPCFVIPINLTTYTVTKVMEPITGTTVPGFRWGGCHGVGVSVPPGTTYGAWTIDNLAWTGYASGPYVNPPIIAKSLDGGTTWNSDTSLATGALIDFATSAGKCGPSPWMVGSQCVDLTNAATQCGSNPYGVTGYQCVKVKMAGDMPCNASPSSLEATKWPCPWHSGWAYGPGGMTIQPNDYFQESDPDGGGGHTYQAKSEKFRVLTKAPDGQGNYILELQRWAACDNPTSDPLGTPPACTWFTHLYDNQGTHPNGWGSAMAATGTGSTTMLWVNLAGSDWAQDTSDITVGHSTFAKSPDGLHMTQIGAGVSRTGDLPAVVASPPQVFWADASSSFNGIVRASGSEVEAYPSSGNWRAATQQQRSLMWDFRHINPDVGTSPEDAKMMWAHTYTLVSGQKYTYKMNIYGDTGDFKSRPVNVFSILSGFKNISGPGSTIDDTKPWTYCQAYIAGECSPGSTKGGLYVAAPNADVAPAACISDSYKLSSPCATPLWSHGGWMVERDVRKNDPLGTHFRRITMGLTGPAAQYQYTSPHMTPDGKFAMVRAGYVNGVRADAVLVKMPLPAAEDSIDRSAFVPLSVRLPAGSGYVRVRFGYAENGAASQFYCTTRQEACVTDASVAPFAFGQSDTLTATDCRNGCTINIPALSGRVVYYRVEKSNNGSTGWVSGATQVRAMK